MDFVIIMAVNTKITIINVKVHVNLYIVTYKDLFLQQYLYDFINVNFYVIPVIDVILVMDINLLVFVHLLDYIHLKFQ